MSYEPEEEIFLPKAYSLQLVLLYLQIFNYLIPRLIFRQHVVNSFFEYAPGILLKSVRQLPSINTARVSGVAIIDFLGELLAGKFNFFNIADLDFLLR